MSTRANWPTTIALGRLRLTLPCSFPFCNLCLFDSSLLSFHLSICKISLKFPGRDVLGEHLVNRFIAAVSSFWLVEPEIHNAQQPKAAEDETGFATKIGLVRLKSFGSTKAHIVKSEYWKAMLIPIVLTLRCDVAVSAKMFHVVAPMVTL